MGRDREASMSLLQLPCILIEDGYSWLKAKPLIAVRNLTLPEVKALSAGSHVEFVANDGTLRRLKINGAVKTWKRDSKRVEVPVKYGYFECARLATAEALRRLVVRV